MVRRRSAACTAALATPPAELVPCTALVELCCDEDSALSALAPEYGLESLRITQADAFETEAGVEKACSFLRARPGADAWASLPCTPWCTWHFINEKRLGPAFCARLAWRRRQSLKLVHNAGRCFEEARATGGGCHFEWPRHCRGWQRRGVRALVHRFELKPADFEGCAVGVEASPGVPAKKPWTVATTRPRLAAALRRLRCSGDNEHCTLSGAYATRSGHYTDKLCHVVLEELAERPRRPASGAWATASGSYTGKLCTVVLDSTAGPDSQGGHAGQGHRDRAQVDVRDHPAAVAPHLRLRHPVCHNERGWGLCRDQPHARNVQDEKVVQLDTA